MSKETPLMQQFNAIKSKYPDAILLFRVGDFYETFGEDAVKASKALGITLTKRHNGSAGEVPLAGIPYHALDSYLPKLVKNGYRVAICEQLEDPKSVKGIVKRGVTEVITPGITSQDNILDANKNNFLASISFWNQQFGIAFLDISTGEFYITGGNWLYIQKVLQSYNPSEIIYPKSFDKEKLQWLSNQFYTYPQEDWIYGLDYSKETLLQKFKTISLKGFGIEDFDHKTIAASAILHYLNQNEQKRLDHILKISILQNNDYVWLDNFSIRNLELVHSVQPGAISLFDVLNKTTTGMGSRLLQRWILMPLINVDKISQRLERVEELIQMEDFRNPLNNYLKQIGDLERLISKVAMNKATPRDIVQLKKSQQIVVLIIDWIKNTENTYFKKYLDLLNPCFHLIEKIDLQLIDEAPAVLNKGCVFKKGVDPHLDENLSLMTDGKEYLFEIQQREALRTEITNLKIGFNNVFGYFLEVTNSHKNKVPSDWIRKQTLTGAERYITPELKEYEQKILGAEDRMYQIQDTLWQKLLLDIQEFVETIQNNSKTLAELDVLACFAQIAIEYDYHRPEINEGLAIDIKQGRHPVIERKMPIDQPYIPNDVFLSNDDQQIILLTGPNMSGKSAVLRQTALIVLMAQMGCFVPAQSAQIGFIDKLFTRVGANDNLSMGESTFMVEMNETASIVNNFSQRSLILLDEIGRGTSTYDGISIAWSLAEFIYFSEAKPKTLFATHYHELNELGEKHDRIQNYHIQIKEIDGQIYFLRKLAQGGSEHSFGIHVAKIAGMPADLIKRAEHIMQDLEQKSVSPDSTKNKMATIAKQTSYQMSIFDEADPIVQKIREEIKKLNVNALSPMEALIKLNEWKSMLQ